MDAIRRRGAAIHFVCSERDASLEQMAFYFGRGYAGLKSFPEARLTTVPHADHNMTPEAAHDAVVNVIRDTVLRLMPNPTRAAGVASGLAVQSLGTAERVGA